MSDAQAARLLGWTSMAIAATEILGARWLQRKLGLRGQTTVLQALGVREALSGAAILSQTTPNGPQAAALWSRVAGDAIDLAYLASAARDSRNKQGLGAITLIVLGATAVDIYYASRVQQSVCKNWFHAMQPRAAYVKQKAEVGA